MMRCTEPQRGCAARTAKASVRASGCEPLVCFASDTRICLLRVLLALVRRLFRARRRKGRNVRPQSRMRTTHSHLHKCLFRYASVLPLACERSARRDLIAALSTRADGGTKLPNPLGLLRLLLDLNWGHAVAPSPLVHADHNRGRCGTTTGCVVASGIRMARADGG